MPKQQEPGGFTGEIDPPKLGFWRPVCIMAIVLVASGIISLVVAGGASHVCEYLSIK